MVQEAGVRPEAAAGSLSLPRISRLRRLRNLAAQNPVGTLAGVLLLLLIFAGITAPVIAPYDVDEFAGDRLMTPTLEHPLGTDQLGRDLLTRVLYGARVSLLVGFGAALVATIVGTMIGLVSAYYGGLLDTSLQRVVDAAMSFPPLIAVLALLSTTGTPELYLIIVALGAVIAPRVSRIIRGVVLTIKSLTYVESARAVGAGGFRIMVFHILPNIAPYAIVLVTVLLGNVILAEAALSFLGYGVQPPTPSWGSMLSGSVRTYMFQDPWLAIPPGVALVLTVLAVNIFGDTLRDVLDPRTRKA